MWGREVPMGEIEQTGQEQTGQEQEQEQEQTEPSIPISKAKGKAKARFWIVEGKTVAHINQTTGKRELTNATSEDWVKRGGPFLLRRSALRAANKLDKIQTRVGDTEFEYLDIHRIRKQ